MTKEQLESIKADKQLNLVNKKLNGLEFGSPRYQAELSWCCDRIAWLHKFHKADSALILLLSDKACEIMQGTWEGDDCGEE